MLEKPDLCDEKIHACLQQAYGLEVIQIEFLPLGVDQNTAVYCVVDGVQNRYFLKLRSGTFDKTSVLLPKFMAEQGIAHIISPQPTQTGQLWANLEGFKAILYPFIEGRNGYEVALSDAHWQEMGRTLRQIHRLALPLGLQHCIQSESYSPQWRESLKALLVDESRWMMGDLPAQKTTALMRERRTNILALVRRAEQLARELQSRSADRVLCHCDLHAGNILIDARDNFFIVDWDNPILALKERDLMYPGGVQGFLGHTPKEEEQLFFQGYGQVQIDREALAYYRYERIVQDIAIFCEQLVLTTEGGEDREQSYRYLESNFLPGGTIEVANKR